MRLYSKTGTHQVVHGEETFEADEDGGFEVPHELGLQLQNTHINGEKVWEDDGERSLRLLAEEDARRRDPKALYELLEKQINRQASTNEDEDDDLIGDRGPQKASGRTAKK